MSVLDCPQGQFRLQRLPLPRRSTAAKSQPLQAWDAADELLLQHVFAQTIATDSSLLLINDSFGALTCALHNITATNWGDSFTSHLACRHNLALNQLGNRVDCLASTSALTSTYDWVLIKIPKTLALLEYQLIGLKGHIHADSTVVAAGMVKYLQRSQLALFEKYLGPTTTSLAKKKARLIHPTLERIVDEAGSLPGSLAADIAPNLGANLSLDLAPNLYNSPYPSSYFQADLQLTISNHANVFARDKLDVGARFMIEQFSQLPAANTIVDLGCGNGVLGIMAKKAMLAEHQLDSQIHYVDESYMAIASARDNHQHCLESEGESAAGLPAVTGAQYHISDAMEQADCDPVELILCNPPFHQGNAQGDQIAWRMFNHALRALRPGGQLWVVANRHLHYGDKLMRLFGNCRNVASNKKFVVLACQRQS